jgi:DNA-binding CsgD family transcriptional regulator
MRIEIANTLIIFGQVATAEGDNAAARSFYEECLAMGYKPAIPAALEGLASAATQEEPGRAAHLWGAAEALRETFGAPLPPLERPGYEQAVSAARTRLGEKTFAAVWAEGRMMTPEQALAAQEQATLDFPAPAARPSVPPAKSTTTYPDGLTAREVEVLRLIALGLTDAQVAERLVISRRTVHTHLNSIYSKLTVNSRSAATRYAIEHHLA